MTSDFRSIILHVLTLVGYEESKEAYADEFIRLCLEKTTAQLLESLPSQKQSYIQKRLKEMKSFHEFEQVIVEFTSQDSYTKVLRDVVNKAFQDIIKSILPALTKQKKEELYLYIKSVNKVI